MRKFLVVAAVGALVLLMSAPVMALDFKFGAEYRVRFYDYANVGFTSQAGSNPRGIQTRVRPRFDVSDDNGNIQATLRLEYGDTEWGGGGGANGSPYGRLNGGGSPGIGSSNVSLPQSGARVGNGAGGAAGTDGVSIETKWAYMDFALPFGIPLRIRAGQQAWYLPDSMIIDDDFSGLKAYGSIKPVSYEFWFFRGSRADGSTAVPAGAAGALSATTTKDNSMDFYGGKLDFALAKAINPYLYGFYVDNRAACVTGNTGSTAYAPAAACANSDHTRPGYYIGVGATGDLGFMSWDINGIYGKQDGGPMGTLFGVDGQPLEVKGYAIQGGVHIPIGPLRWNIVGSYASGDKQDNSGHESDAFPGGPAPSWSGPSQVAGGTYELIGEGGAFDVVTFNQGMTNLWTIGTSIEYNPVKALTLRAHYLFAGFASSSGNCARSKGTPTHCFGPSWQGSGWTQTGTNVNGNPVGTGGIASKSTLGQEFGLKAEYLIWTGFKVQGFAGWLIPSEGDTAGKYILQLYYNF